jgi:hypothetical protein
MLRICITSDFQILQKVDRGHGAPHVSGSLLLARANLIRNARRGIAEGMAGLERELRGKAC